MSLTVPTRGGGSSGTLDPDEEGTTEMGYQQTLMYGRYSRSLGDYAKEEAKRQKFVEKQRRKEYRRRRKELSGSTGGFYGRCARIVTFVWKHTFAKIGEDWVFLAVLGVVMALVSYAMDYGIETCNTSRLWLYRHLGDNMFLQYLSWVCLPVFLILFASGFVHVVAPQAIGSGIPEMKTILRGVVLKEYLTGRTLLAKCVGLTATLGSGMPLGKEGPFVHIASIVATLLTKLVTSFQGIYANESRNSEMLAAACAVGVACCFGSPIGGVLFSIEVTSVYFAVRNYWRGFFSAVCGAMIFRLISIWFDEEETIVAVFMTGFRMDFPYDPQELFIFALIGVFCGLGGALYVYLHRRYVLWMRGNKALTKFLQKNRFIYPFLVSLFISSLSFPPGLGQFQAADISTHKQVEILFSNYSWTQSPEDMTVDEWEHIKHWQTQYTSVFINLALYILLTFFLSILAATLPVPTGVLIPSFKVGAAFGRLIGEAMHVWFPDGVRYGNQISFISPGGYATVGAAAFTGAVTHTISISVIVFEMTGQITHCVPVLIAVLISNAIASLLQPSCYDSIILIKKLPYLPDILPSSSTAYNLFVEDFMIRNIKYIWYGMSYRDLREVLRDGRKLRSFPLVDNPDQMVLLGSIQRTELITAIERHIGKNRRLEVAALRYEQEVKRQKDEEKRLKEEEQRNFDEELAAAAERAKDEPKTKERRPSRFAVTAVTSDPPKASAAPNHSTIPENEELRAAGTHLDPNSPAMRALQQLSSKPKKSILKKSNSYTIHSFGVPGLSMSPESRIEDPDESSVYRTVAGGEKRWKNTIDNIQQMFKMPSNLTLMGSHRGLHGSGPGSPNKKVTISRLDMTLEEQRTWEEMEMEKPVDFNDCHIDPAPFQLVEKTSLLKVHSLFSMLGVNHAYVTAIGRLIGVVGLKELRKAIEDANSGQNAPRSTPPPTAVASEDARIEVDPKTLAVGSMDSAFSANSVVTSDEEEAENELLEKNA